MLSKVLACLLVTVLLQGLEALPSEQPEPRVGAADVLRVVDQTLKRADLLFEQFDTFGTKKGIPEDVNALSNNTNVNILKCLAKYENQLIAAVENGKVAIRSCLTRGEEDIAKLREKFDKIREQLKAKAEELQKIYAACLAEGAEDPAAIEECVVQNGQDVINELVELLIQLRDAIPEGEKELYQIIVAIRNCIVQAVITAKDEIAQISHEIHNCVVESN